MIVEQDGTFTFMHDIGRPSFTNDEEFEFWRKHFIFIEQCDIPIVVNGVYHMMRDWCDQKKKYVGDGYKFCFWFQSDRDRERFRDGIDKVRGYRLVEVSGDRLIRYKQYLYDHFKVSSLPQWTRCYFKEEPLT